ncbi:MAG: alpha/beta hydrolase [Bacteroidia bacterium]
MTHTARTTILKSNCRLLILILTVLLAIGSNGQECGTRTLDPDVAGFLKIIGYQDLTLEQLRAMPIEQLKYPQIPLLPYPKEDVQRIKVTRDSIPVLVFNPLHKEHLPVIIQYHGGGFISPLVPGLEQSLWQDARNYEAVVFAVDYRVAPEHRFPTAVDDSYASFQWISENAQRFGGDTNRIVLMGNSAGANLVTAITQRAKKAGIGNRIQLQVLNGLPADLRPQHMESSDSYRQNATGYFQTKALCYFAVERYAPEQYNDPEVSPILAADFSGLPPALIVSAEFDPMRDDSPLYAAKLRAAGVTVWEKCFSGQLHCLIGAGPESKAQKELVALVRNAMSDTLSK